MKNNIKVAPEKFQEDRLYFQHFMLIYVFAQISNYHYLNRLSILMIRFGSRVQSVYILSILTGQDISDLIQRRFRQFPVVVP